jgi:molybdenum cofactor cytidylyltransferase
MRAPIVIILAAGKGERFLASGGTTHKLDARLGDRTVLAHVIQAVEAAGLAWQLIRPQGGTRGMGESISLGIKATPEASGWLILPADLPFIQPVSLQRVAEGLRKKPLVVPQYCQRQGHPVGFSQQFKPSLLALAGDVGARDIVKSARRDGKVLDLPLDDDGIVQDIDTLADLDRAARRLKMHKPLLSG